MINSYTPVQNWGTETLSDFQYDTGYQLAVRMKNTTTLSGQPGLIKHSLSQSKEYCLEGWVCGAAKAVPALESRKHRTKEKKLNSMKIVLPAQDGRGKEAIFSSKQGPQKGKATSEIRSALCLTKLLLHSAAPEVAWHLLSSESLNWWAEVTVLSAVCTWSLRGAQCWPTLPPEHLAALASGCWIPVGTVAQIPQKPRCDWIKPQLHSDFNTDEGDLHQSHMALQVIYWTSHVSVVSWRLLSYLPAHGVQHSFLGAPTTLNSQVYSQDPDCELILYTQAPCFNLRYHGVSPLHACTLLQPKPMEWIYL